MKKEAAKARLTLLIRAIKRDIPDFQIRYKDESIGQKFLGALMFFNRAYMKDFITTFYPNVYWPTKKSFEKDPIGSFKILAHEYQHLVDNKKNRFWFGFSYILPQILGLISLGALLAIWFSNWFLMFLCALIFVLPWPAYFRKRWEMRGYAVSMAVDYWLTGRINETQKKFIEGIFTGSGYYFMWPIRGSVRKELDEYTKQIKSNEIIKVSQVFPVVRLICEMTDVRAIETAER